MDDLVNLQVFSIGNNNIQTVESLSYLLKFEHIRILNLSGNQVCKLASYKNYCLAHFKNLKYLDYRLVDDESIDIAKKAFVDSIIAIEEEEKVFAAKRLEEKKQTELNKLHNKAHILHIDTVFDRMFDEDVDFKKIVPIAPAIISDLKEEYRAKFDIVVREMKHLVMKKTSEKDEEVLMIQLCIKDVKGESDNECLKKIKEFYHDKKYVSFTHLASSYCTEF
jgi:hypothetical protein